MGKKLISKNLKVCKTIFCKGFGLMFSRKKEDFAMVFPFKKSRRLSITMCCVFYPIDIVFLDENGVVVELVENLKPFKDYVPHKSARTFIELPSGYIKKFKLSNGTILNWHSEGLFVLDRV